MKQKQNNPLKGLTKGIPPPSLVLNQQVKVVAGKHKGKKGKVFFYHPEGNGGRITLLLSNGSYIFVDKDDIDFKFEGVFIGETHS